MNRELRTGAMGKRAVSTDKEEVANHINDANISVRASTAREEVGGIILQEISQDLLEMLYLH